jgi:CheY-like chemotaxis protein
MAPPQAARILVVDDERIIRALLRRVLEKDGYTVAEADNGAVALVVFQRFRPHLVLMDVMMPVMDGVEACAALQQFPEGERAPVLMVTAVADKSLALALAAGALGCIPKPIDWAALRSHIRALLQQPQEDANILPVRSPQPVETA